MKKRLSVEVWLLTQEEFDANDVGGINDCFVSCHHKPEIALKSCMNSIKRTPGERAGSVVKVVVFEETVEGNDDITSRTSVEVGFVNLLNQAA